MRADLGEITVVVGVVVDSVRMHRTKSDWEALLADLDRISEGRLAELKGRELYRGNAYWRRLDSGERSDLIESIIRWMAERKHAITFGAVSRSRLAKHAATSNLGGLQDATEWAIAAMHLILGVQKQHQKEPKNKGNTVFVFDNAKEKDELLRLVHQPPKEVDGFYGRKRKQLPLDQVVDVPYFVDSRDVGLIQVADLFAFILRLYAELAEGISSEKFDGEIKRLREWLVQMKPVILPDSVRWPQRSSEASVSFFRSVGPPSLLRLTG